MGSINITNSAIKSYKHLSVFKNIETALRNFTHVYKFSNNFWLHDSTEKPQTYLESLNIENFKNVRDFGLASSCQKLLASKIKSKI